MSSAVGTHPLASARTSGSAGKRRAREGGGGGMGALFSQPGDAILQVTKAWAEKLLRQETVL
ncbi:hypothetical protein GCM10012319_56670 [Comamonas sp. KCTC 72670]|nr:hypothetical protein GCM10012319_56670 [Comamonas sp. KCTC 72670]